MKAAVWMAAVSLAAWAAVALFVDHGTAADVLLGLLAPVAVAIVSWVVVERAHARAPERLTALMIKAFAAKMVVFGAYVAVMIGLLARRPGPFVAGFTVSFVGLYAWEAALMQRMMSRARRAP